MDTSLLDQYDAIIFDMDGTLVDSGQLHEIAWTRTLDKYGIPVDRVLMRSLAGVPTKGTLDILLDHFNLNIAATSAEMNDFKESVVRDIAQRYVKPTALVEQAQYFAGRKPLSVGTGAYTEEAETILAWCNLRELIGPVVGADQVQNPKPAPDTFLLCAERMGIAPERCVVLEDSKLGLDAATRAGMVGIDVLDVFGIENDYFL
ncbi:HAD-IA family hydrolase [Teredinibacter purpureus]|uniref:HAD-IA family hydrolase n=1 Tax=Teredinibacter purpureus TaxID=2731756 RepID=UPI000B23E359|nr:HAD-IA family hydrolase [Teredinibacter purpureus]